MPAGSQQEGICDERTIICPLLPVISKVSLNKNLKSASVHHRNKLPRKVLKEDLVACRRGLGSAVFLGFKTGGGTSFYRCKVLFSADLAEDQNAYTKDDHGKAEAQEFFMHTAGLKVLTKVEREMLQFS